MPTKELVLQELAILFESFGHYKESHIAIAVMLTLESVKYYIRKRLVETKL
jgi:hypothetical protein